MQIDSNLFNTVQQKQWDESSKTLFGKKNIPGISILNNSNEEFDIIIFSYQSLS